MIGSTSSMMMGIGVFDLVFRWCINLVLKMLFCDVGLTEVDGAFTLGGATVSSGGVSPGTTLCGVLLVMILVSSLSAFVWRSFCWVDNVGCKSWVILRAW